MTTTDSPVVPSADFPSPADAFGGAFSGRTVLVTGHTGFKGTWLSLWLERLGARVVGLSLAPAAPSLCRQVGLEASVASVHGDVRDAGLVAHVVRVHEPEFVFHLAAQPLVLESYRRPVDTLATNVMGTAHVLEALRRAPSVRAAVVVTSDKCYAGTPEGRPFTEEDRLGGADPYSASKAAAELVVETYRASYFPPGSGVGVASVRAGNIVGGGDWAADRIVPDCVRALAAGTRLALRHPEAVRPWQHVLEPVAGYLQLAAMLGADPVTFSGAWNFGPAAEGRSTTVAQVVDAVGESWRRGGGRPLLRHRPAAAVTGPYELALLRLDTTKANAHLAWRPLLDFADTVAFTTEWYWRHANEAGFDPRAATLAQIARYEAAAGADTRSRALVGA